MFIFVPLYYFLKYTAVNCVMRYTRIIDTNRKQYHHWGSGRRLNIFCYYNRWKYCFSNTPTIIKAIMFIAVRILVNTCNSSNTRSYTTWGYLKSIFRIFLLHLLTAIIYVESTIAWFIVTHWLNSCWGITAAKLVNTGRPL